MMKRRILAVALIVACFGLGGSYTSASVSAAQIQACNPNPSYVCSISSYQYVKSSHYHFVERACTWYGTSYRAWADRYRQYEHVNQVNRYYNMYGQLLYTTEYEVQHRATNYWQNWFNSPPQLC